MVLERNQAMALNRNRKFEKKMGGILFWSPCMMDHVISGPYEVPLILGDSQIRQWLLPSKLPYDLHWYGGRCLRCRLTCSAAQMNALQHGY